jgi:hypothetical protein
VRLPSARFRSLVQNSAWHTPYGESLLFVKCSVVDPDLDPDPYVFGPLGSGSGSVIICTNPDPSIKKKKSMKNLDFYYFVTSFDFFL